MGVWTHHIVNTPYCEHTVLWTHHIVDTPYCEHTIVWTHHTVNTPYCEHTILWTHHIVNTPYCEHTSQAAILLLLSDNSHSCIYLLRGRSLQSWLSLSDDLLMILDNCDTPSRGEQNAFLLNICNLWQHLHTSPTGQVMWGSFLCTETKRNYYLMKRSEQRGVLKRSQYVLHMRQLKLK
jgi:endogenous inhibitor of DNA gyrase (YacG/DUF329 family)